MKIAQRDTAIDCFHRPAMVKQMTSQNERVMAVIKQGRDYSLSELMALTNTHNARRAGLTPIDKSSMSRVVNCLRAANRLEAVEDGLRKCAVTGMTITPSRLKSKQGSLFATNTDSATLTQGQLERNQAERA